MPPRTTPLLAVGLAALVAGFAQPPEAATAAPTRAEKALIRAVNNARANHGVRRLRLGSTLQAGAHRWARYLLTHETFFHGSLASGVTENIGWLTCRSGWPRVMVRMWLDSPAHRSNLLDRGARRLGAGVATGGWNGYRCVRMAVTRFR